MEWHEISQAMIRIADETIDHLQGKVKAESYASGNLHDSFRYQFDDHLELGIYADPSFQFVEHGRKANSPLPPKDPILAWMRSVGIEDSALHQIRKKIARDGIQPKHFLQSWIEDNDSKWSEILSDAAFEDLTKSIHETFDQL